MTPADWMLLAAILILILFSAFFSSSETALTAASRARLHSMERNGNTRAITVQNLIRKKDRLIGTILIGNNLSIFLPPLLLPAFS